jgi:integrase
VITNHLLSAFGDAPLRDLTPLALQTYFSGMAHNKLSFESRDKIRDVLSSIPGSAVQYSLLVKNPVVGIKLPRDNAARRSKPHVTPAQFDALLALITEPYATMVYTAVYTGLRVSELVGLRWRCIHDTSISIEERYCRGDWGPPKSTASAATIPVNHSVIERIHHLKTMSITVRSGRATRTY